MTARLLIPGPAFDALDGHLSERPEQAAFMLARVEEKTFEVIETKLLSASDYAYQSDLHLRLVDEMRPELLQWATGAGAALVEAHSHGTKGFPEFSGSDRFGFQEWVPHVRWRLPGLPYAALVQAGRRWDGLAWFDDDPEALTTIEITGTDQTIVTTGHTLAGRIGDPGDTATHNLPQATETEARDG